MSGSGRMTQGRETQGQYTGAVSSLSRRNAAEQRGAKWAVGRGFVAPQSPQRTPSPTCGGQSTRSWYARTAVAPTQHGKFASEVDNTTSLPWESSAFPLAAQGPCHPLRWSGRGWCGVGQQVTQI